MKRSIVIFAVSALTFTTVDSVVAQVPAPASSRASSARVDSVAGGALPQVGSRIRITYPGLGISRATGTLTGSDSEWLIVDLARHPEFTSLPRDGVTELDVSVGTHRNVLKGGLIGGLIGLGAGVMLGLASGDDQCGSCFMSFTAGDKAAILGATLGIGGGLFGLVLGALNRSDYWERP